MIEKSYDFHNYSQANVQEILNNILTKNLGFNTKITELGKYMMKINYFESYIEESFQNENIILIRQDPDNRCRIIFKGKLTENQILELWNELCEKLNSYTDSNQEPISLMTKNEAILEIIDGIKKKGYDIDTMDAIEFIDNFNEKYSRYPNYSEIESIINSYINSQSKDFDTYGISIQKDENFKEDSFNQINEIKPSYPSNYEDQINYNPNLNQFEQISNDGVFGSQNINNIPSNEDIAQYNQEIRELNSLEEEESQRQEMIRDQYNRRDIEQNISENILYPHLEPHGEDIELYLITTIGPYEKKQKIVVSKVSYINELKEIAGELFGFYPNDFHLSADGLTLDERRNLKDYDIYDGMEIILIPVSTAGIKKP